MQTIDQINSDIDASLKDNPPRSSSPLLVRGILKKLAAFVNDYTSDLAGRVAYVAGVSGIATPADGLAGIRYYPILELPATTGGTYDFADIQLTSKPWDVQIGGQSTHTNLYVANRGGFYYEYNIQGNVDGVGLEAYLQADGRIIVYVRSDNAFRAWSIRVPNFLQATIYPTTSGIANPPGTLKFSSLQVLTYRPILSLRRQFTSLYAENAGTGVPPDVINIAGSAQLSIAANLRSGQSEVGFINGNTYNGGGGFSFWQMVSSSTKKLLGFFNASGDFAISGTLFANAYSSVSNPTTANIADGQWLVWRNTTNNEVRVWTNVGGTLKSTLLS